MSSKLFSLEDCLLLAGRCGYAALFLPDGVSKALHFSQFAGSLALKGLPFAPLMAALAMAAAAAGGLAMLLGLWPRVTAALLIAFTLIATALSHQFWLFEEAARRSQEIQFFKNVGLIGGLLFYAVSGAGRLSLGSRKP
jgi:putative oxidoreductase